MNEELAMVGLHLLLPHHLNYVYFSYTLFSNICNHPHRHQHDFLLPRFSTNGYFFHLSFKEHALASKVQEHNTFTRIVKYSSE